MLNHAFKKLDNCTVAFNNLCRGWPRWIVRLLCVGVLLLIGVFRVATDAQFVFASLAVFPVIIIAWIDGKRNGLMIAGLASAIWAMGDITSGYRFKEFWIPWVNAAIHLVTYIVIALLAAQVRLQYERERDQATKDPLTGLNNRRAFLERGANEVERMKRYSHPMAVIYFDLDDFKKLNDTSGHEVGDIALQAAAKALLEVLRSTDQVARLGGDEFAVLLIETDYDAAVTVAQKMFLAVNAALENFPPVKSSLGIAWFEKADRLFPAMLKAADELMYEVKKEGKDNFRSQRFV